MRPDEEKLYLILGCFGRTDTTEAALPSFISCSGIENKILKLDESLQQLNDIMDYIDSVRLFDRPLFDGNGIKNFIFHMQKKYYQDMKPIWKEGTFSLYEKFIHNHKLCGTYIKLALLSQSDFDNKTSNAPTIIISASNPDKAEVVMGKRGLRLISPNKRS